MELCPPDVAFLGQTPCKIHLSATVEILPLAETASPADQGECIDAVRQACEAGTPIYPIGGGTSLNYGLPARKQGLGLSLANLNRVVDYPARDMTVTVEAGITMTQLAQTLAAQGQRLPIDAPRAEQATLGGLIATNHSGPRRFGCGTIRDYVIGISAVDGRGMAFKGGGRVVKNVAGYDFCKLLTGSMGTLGVITQVTLKVKPLAETSAFLTCACPDWDAVERLLAGFSNSQVTPTCIDAVSGPAWSDAGLNRAADTAAHVAVGLEGPATEVRWMSERLRGEWLEFGDANVQTIENEAAVHLWRRLTEFPAEEDGAPLLRFSVLPSGTVDVMRKLREIDPACSLQSQAGNGVVLCRLSQTASDLARTLISTLQPLAARAGGTCVVYAYPAGLELTRQATWGGAASASRVMLSVKEQFDPQGLLNPGRFIYGK